MYSVTVNRLYTTMPYTVTHQDNTDLFMRVEPLSYFMSLNGVEILLSGGKRISSETRAQSIRVSVAIRSTVSERRLLQTGFW
jgi:hypothetical protein